MSQNYAHMLTERFLRYAAVNTQSDGSAGQVPSTPGQLELARMLSGELEDMGLEKLREPLAEHRLARHAEEACTLLIDIGIAQFVVIEADLHRRIVRHEAEALLALAEAFVR